MNKKLSLSLILFFTSLVLFSCKKEKEVIETKEKVSKLIQFEIEKTNSDSDFSSKVVSFTTVKKERKWLKNSRGDIRIYYYGYYSLSLENGDTLLFNLFISKDGIDPDIIQLSGDNIQGSIQDWRYSSLEIEQNEFLENPTNISFEIGAKIFNPSNDHSTFESTEISKIEENSITLHQLKINFSGKAFGIYDPNGIYEPVYHISNGVFKDIIQ